MHRASKLLSDTELAKLRRQVGYVEGDANHPAAAKERLAGRMSAYLMRAVLNCQDCLHGQTWRTPNGNVVHVCRRHAEQIGLSSHGWVLVAQ